MIKMHVLIMKKEHVKNTGLNILSAETMCSAAVFAKLKCHVKISDHKNNLNQHDLELNNFSSFFIIK